MVDVTQVNVPLVSPLPSEKRARYCHVPTWSGMNRIFQVSSPS